MFRQAASPAVLHVGNIGNNAYQNARILNREAIPSDVLCYDYYHAMGCPEWEDALVDRLPDSFDENKPEWHRLRLSDFERPDWFAQGPLRYAVAYLAARRTGRRMRARAWHGLIKSCCRIESDAILTRRLALFLDCLRRIRGFHGGSGLRSAVRRLLAGSDPLPPLPFRTVCEGCRTLFPDRPDSLVAADLAQYVPGVQLMGNCLSLYDIVLGYSTDCIYPLLAGHRCYFAYEHGTLRAIPFEDSPTGRLTALAYRKAACVFITNCDNIRAAERLGLTNYRYIPHPINDRNLALADGTVLRCQLMERFRADFIVFHPSRLHWEPELRHPSWEKGNDLFLRGFARFVRETAPRALCILARWGQKLRETDALLRDEGITGRVHWISPVPNRTMLGYVKAADAVADQFWLGTFGGITPKALGCGRPTLLHLDPEVHRWCFPELPPVLNVRDPVQISAALASLYRDPAHAREIGARSEAWYRTYHSESVVRDRLVSAIRECWRPGL